MYEYDFHTYSVRRKRSKKRIFVSIGTFFFVLFIFFTSVRFFSQEQQSDANTVVSPVGYEVVSFIDKVINTRSNTLERIVTDSLGDAPGAYSISIHQVQTDESYALHEHRVFTSASLYKLWVMATVFEQIEQGRFKEEDLLHGDVSFLNKKFGIASESAELTEGDIDLTVAQALKQMITISHNYAALLLTERVKLKNIQALLERHGLHDSKVGTEMSLPVTTAADIELFFEKLVNGEFANETNTQKMLDLLKAQRLNNKLQKYLPEDTVVAHKTGELGLVTHDAGIVYIPNGDYIIVILSETPNPAMAEEKIAIISKAVYEYMIDKK